MVDLDDANTVKVKQKNIQNVLVKVGFVVKIHHIIHDSTVVNYIEKGRK